MPYVTINSGAQAIIDAVNQGVDGGGLSSQLSASGGSNQIG